MRPPFLITQPTFKCDFIIFFNTVADRFFTAAKLSVKGQRGTEKIICFYRCVSLSRNVEWQSISRRQYGNNYWLFQQPVTWLDCLICDQLSQCRNEGDVSAVRSTTSSVFNIGPPNPCDPPARPT